MGNLQSVKNILDYLKVESVITNKKEDLEGADAIILPGVGAFGAAMEQINKTGLVEVLRSEALDKKKPFLGICLGMQLIGSKSYEGGEFAGLNFLPGEVRLLKPKDDSRIPHIGWNEVVPKQGTNMYGVESGNKVFYFVHSYHFVPENKADISGTVDYGGEVVASLEHENIWATQFHPEKSQKDGIDLLKNFLFYIETKKSFRSETPPRAGQKN